MVIKSDFWEGRKVFLTGHTGFKGGWLSLWLTSMGAQVHGYSLAPSSTNSFFEEIGISNVITKSTLGDIRDYKKLNSALIDSNASIVFHLAAQPLVIESYKDPKETYETNVMGTINLFDSIRNSKSVKTIVNITTDKCYENQESIWPYRENDPLGGYDPYSSSKSCVEILSSSYRSSFFNDKGIYLATVRAGNVIGGGDWSNNRLVPDFFRSIEDNKELLIRSPSSIRPWQHVLDPLYGYLLLSEKLTIEGKLFAQAWNFGPNDKNIKTVSWILNFLSEKYNKKNWIQDFSEKPHETKVLKLDSTKAKINLNWQPQYSVEESLNKTVSWHNEWKKGNSMKDFTIHQIQEYYKHLSKSI
jgi:CDP-glucose 4,6-dehydratase